MPSSDDKMSGPLIGARLCESGSSGARREWGETTDLYGKYGDVDRHRGQRHTDDIAFPV